MKEAAFVAVSNGPPGTVAITSTVEFIITPPFFAPYGIT